jgi:hypothetical protein
MENKIPERTVRKSTIPGNSKPPIFPTKYTKTPIKPHTSDNPIRYTKTPLNFPFLERTKTRNAIEICNNVESSKINGNQIEPISQARITGNHRIDREILNKSSPKFPSNFEKQKPNK